MITLFNAFTLWIIYRMKWIDIRYESVAIVKLEPLKTDPLPSSYNSSIEWTPSFTPAFDYLFDPATLALALQNERLRDRLDVDQIKSLVSTRRRDNLDEIEIRIKHPDAVMSCDIATALCEALRLQRIERKKHILRQRHEWMHQQIIQKSDQIRELEKRLLDIQEQLAAKHQIEKERTEELKNEKERIIEKPAIVKDIVIQMKKQYNIEAQRKDPYGLVIKEEAKVAAMPIMHPSIIDAVIGSFLLSSVVSILIVWLLPRSRGRALIK